jgi:hypothetical protein
MNLATDAEHEENTFQDAQKTGWWASLFIFNSFLFVLVIAKLTR